MTVMMRLGDIPVSGLGVHVFEPLALPVCCFIVTCMSHAQSIKSRLFGYVCTQPNHARPLDLFCQQMLSSPWALTLGTTSDTFTDPALHATHPVPHRQKSTTSSEAHTDVNRRIE